jgi:hypothetical protein
VGIISPCHTFLSFPVVIINVLRQHRHNNPTTDIFIPLTGIMKAQGVKYTHEMNNFLTWKCDVGATMAGHMVMVGQDGDVNIVALMVLPRYMEF